MKKLWLRAWGMWHKLDCSEACFVSHYSSVSNSCVILWNISCHSCLTGPAFCGNSSTQSLPVVFSYKSCCIPAGSVDCLCFSCGGLRGCLPAVRTQAQLASSLCMAFSSNASQHACWPFPDVFSQASSIWVNGVCFPCSFSPFQSGGDKPATVLWGAIPWYGHG